MSEFVAKRSPGHDVGGRVFCREGARAPRAASDAKAIAGGIVAFRANRARPACAGMLVGDQVILGTDFE